MVDAFPSLKTICIVYTHSTMFFSFSCQLQHLLNQLGTCVYIICMYVECVAIVAKKTWLAFSKESKNREYSTCHTDYIDNNYYNLPNLNCMIFIFVNYYCHSSQEPS